MNQVRLLPVALVLVALATDARACSQCSCANPFPTVGFGSPLYESMRYGVENRYMAKDAGLDDAPGIESQRENRLAAFAAAHPSERWVLLARMPYVFKEIEERPEGEVSSTERADGWGDLELRTRFLVTRLGETRGPGGAFVLLGGAYAPTGRSHLTGADGERLEMHLQPGNGAWSGELGAEATEPLGAALVGASVSGRANGTNDEGFHYGNAMLFDVGADTRRYGSLQFFAHANGRVAKIDRTDDTGGTDPNSGGTLVALTPGVRYLGAKGWLIDAGAQFPVVENLNGVQDEHAMARLAISFAP